MGRAERPPGDRGLPIPRLHDSTRVPHAYTEKKEMLPTSSSASMSPIRTAKTSPSLYRQTCTVLRGPPLAATGEEAPPPTRKLRCRRENSVVGEKAPPPACNSDGTLAASPSRQPLPATLTTSATAAGSTTVIHHAATPDTAGSKAACYRQQHRLPCRL